MLSRSEEVSVSGILLLFSGVVFGLANQDIGRIYSIPQSLFPYSAIVASIILIVIIYSAIRPTSRTPVIALIVFTYLILGFPAIYVSGVFGFPSDTLYQLGYVRDILLTGTLPQADVYPLTHLLIAMITQLFDVSPQLAAMSLPSLYFTTYLAGVFLLANTWEKIDLRIAHLVPFCFFLSMGFDTGGFTYFKPYFMAVLFCAFLMAVVVRVFTASGEHTAWKYVMLITFSALSMTHPVAFIGALAMIGVYYLFHSKRVHRLPILPVRKYVPRNTRLFASVLAIALSFATWVLFLGEGAIVTAAQRAFSLITNPMGFFETKYRGGADGGYWKNAIQSQSSTTVYLLRYYGLQYGPALLALLTTGIWAIHSVITARRDTIPAQDLLRDGVIFAWLFGTGTLMLFNATANILNVGITRPVPLLLVVFAIPLGRLATRSQRARRVTVGVLVLCAAVGVVMVFPSPVGYSSTPQATAQDINGMDWLVENKDRSARIDDYQMDQHRFGAFLLGTQQLSERKDIYNTGATTPTTGLQSQLPTYGETGTLQFDTPVYLPISEYDWWYVSRYYPHEQRMQGLQRLSNDPQVQQVYSNGGLEVYYRGN